MIMEYVYIKILILLVVAAFGYFVLVRPQLKRLDIHNKFINSLKKGDKVITSGGLIGEIIEFDTEKTLTIAFSSSAHFNVLKKTIQSTYIV